MKTSYPPELSPAVESAPEKFPSGVHQQGARKTVLVRGWRDINHSYSLVNQFQLIEMLKREDLEILHEDLPYHSPNWSPSQNPVGFDETTTQKLREIPRYDGREVDVALSISSPFSLFEGRAKKVVTFMVTELGLDAKNFANGAVSATRFCQGRNWVISPSEWARQKVIEAGLSAERVCVIPHGVETALFFPLAQHQRNEVRSQIGATPEDFVFLNVGGAFWTKGCDLVLRAFGEVFRKYPQIRLTLKDNRSLYGHNVDATVSQIQATTPNLLTPEVLKRITVLPTALSMEQLGALYSAADMYVTAYRAEGFNLPALEALACGTRVLATAGGPTDAFLHPESSNRIQSTLSDPAVTGIPTKGLYLEPHLDDLIQKMTDAVKHRQVGHCYTPSLGRFLENWSWKSATANLLDHLFA